MKSVCFVSTLAYPLFNPKVGGSIGGAETQQKILAKELVSRGCTVYFVVGDYGQEPDELIEGIRFIKSETAPGRNNLWNIWRTYISLAAAMKKTNADVYIQRANPFYTGQVSFWCKINRKRFVYFTGHDSNCDFSLLPEPLNILVRKAYEFGLNRADGIIVQTDNQKNLLEENFGLKSSVIRSLFVEHALSKTEKEANPEKVIFVGSLTRKKRPDLFIELASNFPEVEFELIGSGEGKYFKDILAKVNGVRNVKFRGTLRGEELESAFLSATALVLTSSAEGFPNVFLEAWHYGTPIISLNIDPDGLLSVKGGGLLAESREELQLCLKKLLQDSREREELIKNGRTVLDNEFDFGKSVN